MFIHSFLGVFFTYMTIWLAIRATAYLKERIEVNMHSIGGFFMLGFVIFLSASGYVTLYNARYK
jgi:type IV secretory pathway TrbL component